MRIAGGELIALDLETNEVLGVRRGYALYRGSGEMTRVCPRYGHDGGRDKTTDFTFWFAGAVLQPPGWLAYVAERKRYRRK